MVHYIPRNMASDLAMATDKVVNSYLHGLEVYSYPLGSDDWVTWWLEKKLDELSKSKDKAVNLLKSDKQALWSLLSLSFSKKFDFLTALV